MLTLFEKLKEFLNQGKGGSSLGLATIFGSLITAVFGIIVAPILGAEDYGVVSYFIATAGIAHAIISFGASHVLLVYLSKGLKIFSTISFVTLVSSIIALIITYVLFEEISIGIVIVGYIVFELANSELLAKQFYKQYIKYFLSQKLIFIFLSIILYFVWGPSGFVAGFGLSMLPGLIRIIFGFKESKIDFSLMKDKINFIINNYFLRISRTAYVNVDRLLVFPMFGFTTLGNYELGLQIILLANVFSVFIHLYTVPKDSKNQSTRKIKFYAILLSIIVSVLVVFFAPTFVPMFFSQFTESVDLIPILGLSIVPHMLIMLHMSKFFGSEKTKPILFGAILHLIFFIVAIVILGDIFSITGIAISFVLSEIVESIYLLVLHKKIFHTYL
jgi:O-antigen/teichoic acid export membrane protein